MSFETKRFVMHYFVFFHPVWLRAATGALLSRRVIIPLAANYIPANACVLVSPVTLAVYSA